MPDAEESMPSWCQPTANSPPVIHKNLHFLDVFGLFLPNNCLTLRDWMTTAVCCCLKSSYAAFHWLPLGCSTTRFQWWNHARSRPGINYNHAKHFIQKYWYRLRVNGLYQQLQLKHISTPIFYWQRFGGIWGRASLVTTATFAAYTHTHTKKWNQDTHTTPSKNLKRWFNNLY